MNFTYFRFLCRNLTSKWYIWLLFGFYLLITALFLLLVPHLLHTAPWDFWGNTTVLPQSMLMFIGALFSAVLAIAIFRDYSDDGTELIIVSKPINRTKIIVTKFLMFVFFSLAFAVSSVFIALGTFAFQQGQDHPDLVGSLVLSLFVCNLVFTLVFGFLAILISLFLNKVWTILLNVIVVTLLTIYSTATLVTVKTPSQIAEKHNSYVDTIKYLTNDHTIQSGAALSPINPDSEDDPLMFNDAKGQSDFWHNCVNQSTSDTAATINVVGEFTQMNNLLGLEKYQRQSSNADFDSSRMFSYDFDKELSIKNPKYIPAFVPFLPNSLGKLGNVPWADPRIDPKIISESLAFLMESEANQRITVLGDSHVSAENEFSTMLDLDQYDFRIAYTNKDWIGSRSQNYYADQIDNMITETDQLLFGKILDFFENVKVAQLFLVTYENSGLYLHPTFKDKLNDEITRSDWLSIKPEVEILFGNNEVADKLCNYFNSEWRDSIHNIYDFLHLVLVANQDSLYPSVKNEDDRRIALMETMMKLKYYLFMNISNQFQSTSDDLQCALNTPVDINVSYSSQNFKFQVASSPILPIGHRNATPEHPMSYLQDPVDITSITYDAMKTQPTQVTLNLDKVMWNSQELVDLINEKIILGSEGVTPNKAPFDGDPMLDSILTINTLTNIACADKETLNDENYHIDARYLPSGWDGLDITIKSQTEKPWKSAFYGFGSDGTRTMMDRALAYLAINTSSYGWENADDEWSFDRNHRFLANLSDDNSMNYPLMYQCLMSPYTVTPIMNNGLVVLGWICMAIVLGSVGATIFVRRDFK